MKKILSTLIIIAALLTPAVASAQFRWGPTVGFDHTTMHFNQDLISVDGKPGFQAGLLSELMFPGIGFGIDMGLMYTMRGAQVNFSEKTVWDDCGNPRSYLHYIDIPINLRFKWTRMQGFEDYLAPYVFGGPIATIMVAHNNVDAFNYSGGDVGAQVGLGVEVFRNWQIQASYIWGLTYAVKTKLLDDFSAQNRTWSLRVTYLF
ncbi:MAG: PorT family protein [Muribaculaceae bacterium]|nr:PorT family protein [Muribaculaceae bacterium]